MNRADARRRDWEPTFEDAAVHPQMAAEIVQETVEECERLLLDAEAIAQELRDAAEQDAARVRREAVWSNARLLTDLEQRRPQVEASLAGVRVVAERATRLSAGVVAEAERRARDLVSTAETRAREVVRRAEEHLAAASGQNAAAEANYREADGQRSHAAARLSEANALMATATIRCSEADALTAAATERAAEADRRLAEATQILAAAEAASAHASTLTASSEEWAAECRSKVEAETLVVVAQAWRSAEALQRELLEEADAEVLEITGKATLDATKIRDEAEDEARELRVLARRQVEAEARKARSRRRRSAAMLFVIVLVGAVLTQFVGAPVRG